MANIENDDLRQPPARNDQQGLKQRWLDFLGRPEGKAALLQFGTSILSPQIPGSPTGTNVAQAFAAGGEAVDRVQTQQEAQRQQQESERLARDQAASQAQAREVAGETALRQAGAAERRAGAAESSVEVQRRGQDLQRELLQSRERIARAAAVQGATQFQTEQAIALMEQLANDLSLEEPLTPDQREAVALSQLRAVTQQVSGQSQMQQFLALPPEQIAAELQKFQDPAAREQALRALDPQKAAQVRALLTGE